MDSIIEFSSGSVDGILAYTGQLFTDLRVIIILAIGLPLGFWVVRKVISLVRAR